jgi:acyl carrier protein/D-alanine--poly(phosphoribitol) ligase subunit 2
MQRNGEKKSGIFPLLKMINLNTNPNCLKKMEDIKELVRNYVIREYLEEGEEITYDSPLISSGYVDSFSMVSLLVFLENKFKIKIPPEKATPEAFDSVNKIVELVNKYINK